MRLRHALCGGVTAAVLVLALVACGQQREATLSDALKRGDLQAAQEQVASSSRTQWRQDTDTLVRAHGALRIVATSGGTTGVPPGFPLHHAIYRIAFADGHERCLWVEARGGGELTLVNGGYVDCGTIPAPSVVTRQVIASPPIRATPRATP